MEAHLQQLETQGFTVVPAAIPAAQLRQIRQAYDGVLDAIRTTKPEAAWCLEAGNIPGAIDFFRTYPV